MIVQLDAPPPVTSEEAVAFMLHHLGLAALYFEGTDADASLMLELKFRNHIALPAAKAWLVAMTAVYSALDKEH